MTNNNQITGIMWMLLHCLLISIMSVMIVVMSEKFHIFQIVFFHNFVAFLFTMPFVIKTGLVANLKTKKLPLHCLRAVLCVVSLAMYFYAITIIPLTQARAIALSAPLISTLLAIFFLKEKTNFHKSIALCIGFIGSIVILQPESVEFSYAILLVVGAVCMWSAIDMIMKILSSDATETQIFYLTAIMSLLSLPGAIYYWQTPENYSDWLWLCAIGVIFLVNVLALFNAFRYADVTTIMPFDFTGMVFTAIIAYFAFDEIVKLEVFLGAAVIVLSSIYIVRKESIKDKHVPQLIVPE